MKKFSKIWLIIAFAAFISIYSISFAAVPTGFTGVFQDSNNDGTVDKVVVVINGGEALSTCTVNATELASDWSYTANGLTGSSISSATCDAGTATITFTISGAPANTTSANTVPTLAYDNDDGDNSIANGSGNLGAVAPQHVLDDAGPIITAANIRDADNNGKIDRMVITFTENIDGAPGAAANGFDVTSASAHGTCDNESADPDGTNTVTLNFTCSTANTAVGDIALNFSANVNIIDHINTNNQAPSKELNSSSSPSITDQAKPILVAAAFGNSGGKNNLVLTYSEVIQMSSEGDSANNITNGDFAISTSTLGDMWNVRQLTGLVTWNGTSNMQNSPGSNKITLGGAGDLAGKVVTVGINDGDEGFFTSGSEGPTTPVVTAIGDSTSLQDLAGNSANSNSSVTATLSQAWDITPPTQIQNYRAISTNQSSASMQWAAHSTLDDFGYYILTYSSSPGATLLGAGVSYWGSDLDATLITRTTTTTTITGLSTGTYYTRIYAVDTEGNVSQVSTETSFNVNPGGSGDAVPPSIPTNLSATLNSLGAVVLTWTDPVESDLGKIDIAKSEGTGIEPSSILASVNAGTQTYTDANVKTGDIVNYKLRSKDSSGNISNYSAVITIKIVDGIQETEENQPDTQVPENVTPDSEVNPDTLTETTSGQETNLPADTSNIPRDIISHWAFDYIAELYAVGAAGGKADGKFEPDSSITRAEFIKIIMIAFKFVQGGNWDSSFKDTDGHWAQSYIEGAFREKLISGYQDGTFRPDAPITRAEAVKILLSATNFDDSAEPAGFSDVKQTDWFARYVNYAVSKNIINGDSGYNTFRPNATITRAEVAKIVALML